MRFPTIYRHAGYLKNLPSNKNRTYATIIIFSEDFFLTVVIGYQSEKKFGQIEELISQDFTINQFFNEYFLANLTIQLFFMCQSEKLRTLYSEPELVYAPLKMHTVLLRIFGMHSHTCTCICILMLFSRTLCLSFFSFFVKP